MTDFSHLDAIDERLLYAKNRVALSKTTKEREWYEHSVRQVEKERDGEIDFLKCSGVKFPTIDEILSDDELMAELESDTPAYAVGTLTWFDPQSQEVRSEPVTASDFYKLAENTDAPSQSVGSKEGLTR